MHIGHFLFHKHQCRYALCALSLRSFCMFDITSTSISHTSVSMATGCPPTPACSHGTPHHTTPQGNRGKSKNILPTVSLYPPTCKIQQLLLWYSNSRNMAYSLSLGISMAALPIYYSSLLRMFESKLIWQSKTKKPRAYTKTVPLQHRTNEHRQKVVKRLSYIQ